MTDAFTETAAFRPMDEDAAMRQEGGMADTQEDIARRRQTIIGAVVIAVLLIGGWWLMSSLQHHRDVEDCIASGRRDCVPVEPTDGK